MTVSWRSPVRLSGYLIALFAIKRHCPAPRVRASEAKLLAVKRQNVFAHSAKSQVLRIEFKCLPVQPRSFRGGYVAWVSTPDTRYAFAIVAVQPQRHVNSN